MLLPLRHCGFGTGAREGPCVNNYKNSQIEFCVFHHPLLYGTLAENETPLSLFCRLCEMNRELWLDIPFGIGLYTPKCADFIPLDERNLSSPFFQLLGCGCGQIPDIIKLDYYCKGTTIRGKTLLTAKYYFVRGLSGVEVFPRRKRTAVYCGGTLIQAKDWAIHHEKKKYDRERRIEDHEQKYKPP